MHNYRVLFLIHFLLAAVVMEPLPLTYLTPWLILCIQCQIGAFNGSHCAIAPTNHPMPAVIAIAKPP
jgi:hypothetical protein